MSLGILDSLVWLVVIQALSFSVLPWLVRLLPSAPDRGYGFSKTFGVFVFGVIAWLLAVVLGVPVTSGVVTVIFAALMIQGYLLWFKRGEISLQLVSVVRHNWLHTEGVFIGAFLLFASIRVLNPEIVWGEKPMDSTFLHFFVRNSELPPQDPWGAGQPMSYYYLGVFLFATLLKLTGIPVGIGYNLAMAMLAGLIAVGLGSVFRLLRAGPTVSLICALSILLATNPEVLWLALFERRAPTFDNTFWPSTRLFTSPFFFEYTSWSMLFADFHAHVIAIPFVVVLLGMGLAMLLAPDDRFSRGGAGLRLAIGALWGSLFAMNTWDFISWGFLVGTLLVFVSTPPFWAPPKRVDGSVALGERLFAHGFSRLVGTSWDLIWLVAGAGCTAIPFVVSLSNREATHWDWVRGDELNTLPQVMGALGYWAVAGMLALLSLIAFLLVNRAPRYTRWRSSLACALGAIAAWPLPVLNVLRGELVQPWGIVVWGCLTMTTAAFVVSRREYRHEIRVSAALVYLAALIVIVLEELFLIDRMNTLFKGYMIVWLLMGVGVSALVVHSCRIIRERMGRLPGAVSLLLPGCFLSASLVGFVLNVIAVVSMQRVPVRYHTLDGMAYLWDGNHDDASAIRWINAAVTGTPTLLEAQGDSYREYTRISMHTGLPTVLGWEHHVMQRGLPWNQVQQRKDAIRTIYSTTDLSLAKSLLLKYRVDLIIVGALERRDYLPTGLAKFAQNPEIFIPIFKSGDTTVYATYFSHMNPRFRERSAT